MSLIRTRFLIIHNNTVPIVEIAFVGKDLAGLAAYVHKWQNTISSSHVVGSPNPALVLISGNVYVEEALPNLLIKIKISDFIVRLLDILYFKL